MDAHAQQNVAKVLPYEARERLRRAAQTDTTYNPMARIIAIDAAATFIKLQYPQFFRKEF